MFERTRPSEVTSGTRVGAFLSMKGGVVEFLGWGRYLGEEIPNGAAGLLSELAVELGMQSPKIQLDDGEVVWGCECWWGPEGRVQSLLDEADEVLLVDIRAVRATYVTGRQPTGENPWND